MASLAAMVAESIKGAKLGSNTKSTINSALMSSPRLVLEWLLASNAARHRFISMEVHSKAKYRASLPLPLPFPLPLAWVGLGVTMVGVGVK